MPGEGSQGPLSHGRRPGRRARSLSPGRGDRRHVVLPRLRRWNRREPELVARLGGLGLVALITQYNYLFVSAHPNFGSITRSRESSLLWAVSAVVFQAMMRSGRHPDRVRVLWSAADILFLTIELKLFEQVEKALLGGDSLVRFETTLLVGYPLLIAASGLWWRVRLVWITTVLAMVRLRLALHRRGARVARRSPGLETKPRPATPQHLPGRASLDRLRRRAAGQAHPALEPVL